MRFTKMHGAGNDFIIIDIMRENIPPASLPALARKLCAAHTSLGADGLMAVTAAKNGGDYAMLFYNADGSLGEMCGNGARCVARYGFEKGLAGEIQRIETTAGLVTGRRLSKRIYQVCLNRPETIDLHRAARLWAGIMTALISSWAPQACPMRCCFWMKGLLSTGEPPGAGQSPALLPCLSQGGQREFCEKAGRQRHKSAHL